MLTLPFASLSPVEVGLEVFGVTCIESALNGSHPGWTLDEGQSFDSLVMSKMESAAIENAELLPEIILATYYLLLENATDLTSIRENTLPAFEIAVERMLDSI